MASKINIGIVYDNVNKYLDDELFNLVIYLIRCNGYVDYAKYSKDINGEEWIEVENPTVDHKLFLIMKKYYYGQLQMKVNLLQTKKIKLDIYVRQHSTFFGFLLSFDESDLLPDYSVKTLVRMTDNIISFVSQLFKMTNFNYAFCDHEAEIYYGPSEFVPDKYSISFLPKSDNALDVRKSDWHINGLTKR